MLFDVLKCFFVRLCRNVYLMLLHVHKSRAYDLDLIDVANDFIDVSYHRKHFFSSEFKQSDRD